jgi:hypothetical protein
MTKLTREIVAMVLVCWLALLGGCSGAEEQSVTLQSHGGFEGV